MPSIATGFDSIEPQFVGLFVAPLGAPGMTGLPAMMSAVHVPRLMCHASLSVDTFDVVIWFSDEYRVPVTEPKWVYQLAPAGAVNCASVNAGDGVIAFFEDDPSDANTAAVTPTITRTPSRLATRRRRERCIDPPSLKRDPRRSN